MESLFFTCLVWWQLLGGRSGCPVKAEDKSESLPSLGWNRGQASNTWASPTHPVLSGVAEARVSLVSTFLDLPHFFRQKKHFSVPARWQLIQPSHFGQGWATPARGSFFGNLKSSLNSGALACSGLLESLDRPRSRRAFCRNWRPGRKSSASLDALPVPPFSTPVTVVQLLPMKRKRTSRVW